MGQIPSTQNLSSVPRIKPTPGSSGTRLIRKNTVGVYDGNSFALHFVKISPTMTVKEIKLQLPDCNVDLELGDLILSDSATVSELGISERDLLKLSTEPRNSLQTSSTDSSIELEKYLKPARRLKDINSTLQQNEKIINVDLVRIAVPDVSIHIHAKHA